ncbi:MAG: helix-turn-helix transcriptional regulator [Flavobacteriales bacterium]|nr:helix-turn-helix transcriptional regulator [Flavobacteriales bacterium]
MAKLNAKLRAFGQAVRSERERQAISQEELADRAGLDRSYVGGVERGERNIGLLNIVKLSEALHVSPGVFFNMERSHG